MDKKKAAGTAGGALLLAIVGLVLKERPWEPSKPESQQPSRPVVSPSQTDEEAVRDVVKKSQILEFCTIYKDPQAYKNPDALAKKLKDLYVPASEGGEAAHEIEAQVKGMCEKKRHYGAESRLSSIAFDAPTFSTQALATVTTRESWYLPYFEGDSQLSRRAEINSSVTYTLQKNHGPWLLLKTTTHYMR